MFFSITYIPFISPKKQDQLLKIIQELGIQELR